MPPKRRLLSRLAVYTALLPLALAHGHEQKASLTAAASTMASTSLPTSTGDPSPVTFALDELSSYFEDPRHRGLMLAHIVVMVIGGLSVDQEVLFSVLNGLGLILGAIYNSSTPDLYPNNSHHKQGWAVTWLVTAQIGLGVMNLYFQRSTAGLAEDPPHNLGYLPRKPSSMEAPPRGLTTNTRFSQDSGHGTDRASSSSSQSPAREEKMLDNQLPPTHDSDLDEGDGLSDDDLERQGFLSGPAFVRHTLARAEPPRWLLGYVLRVGEILYEIINRTVLVLGFTALATGVVTYTGILNGPSVLNGLAHFIKGGIFFWYGLLTLGRWMGCFSDIGWAWNLAPPSEDASASRFPYAFTPSAEFVESFLLFLYGSTNVFLEHLAAWGDAWTASDLEHVSISIMLFGGGMCGMLVESKSVRKMFTASALVVPAFRGEGEALHGLEEPKTYSVPLNPIPPLLTLLLGLIMSSHHQHSMVSSTVHKSWGNLLIGAALARGVTYILTYLSPPTSYLPGRPPSELITAFCLISGGLIFMASNKDTVAAMERYDVNAMFLFTVTMGLTALLMAWEMGVYALKGWAVTFERRRSRSTVAVEVTVQGF